jgi:hypothetical protein
MRGFLIVTLFVSMLMGCKANSVNKIIIQDDVAIKQKADQLKRAFQKLSASPYTLKYQQEYFEAFPNSFTLFNSLFGYTDKEPMGAEYKPCPLTDQAHVYVEAFFKLDGIKKIVYYNRIIEISVNGRWYADGVSYFQHGMANKFKLDTNLFLELLSKRSDKDVKSFWYFYFDGPHPVKEIPEEVQKVKEINSHIFVLIELALNEVQKKWKEE